MSTSDSTYVKQAVLVWFPMPEAGLVEQVQTALEANVESINYDRGMPRTYPGSSGGVGTLVTSVHYYTRGRPISANEFETAFGVIGDGRFDGVALSIDNNGVSTVTFSGR